MVMSSLFCCQLLRSIAGRSKAGATSTKPWLVLGLPLPYLFVYFVRYSLTDTLIKRSAAEEAGDVVPTSFLARRGVVRATVPIVIVA